MLTVSSLNSVQSTYSTLAMVFCAVALDRKQQPCPNDLDHCYVVYDRLLRGFWLYTDA